METSVVVALIGSVTALSLGLYNTSSSAKKTELEALKEQLKECDDDRAIQKANIEQLTRREVEITRRLARLDDVR